MIFSDFLVKRFKTKQNRYAKLFNEVLNDFKYFLMNFHGRDILNGTIKIGFVGAKVLVFAELELSHDAMEFFIGILVMKIFH